MDNFKLSAYQQTTSGICVDDFSSFRLDSSKYMMRKMWQFDFMFRLQLQNLINQTEIIEHPSKKKKKRDYGVAYNSEFQPECFLNIHRKAL